MRSCLRLCHPTTLLVALTGLGAAACTTGDSIADEDEVVAALELDNGGYNTADEAAQFGAEEEFAIADLEADTAYADVFAPDTELADLRNAPGAETHRVAILWGQLPPDRDADRDVDWAGELRVSRGGMVVRRRVGFEAATDRVEPRTDRRVVRFSSMTRPFADGLALEIVDDTPASADPIILTYRRDRDGREERFDLRETRDRPLVRDVDTDRNRIVVAALRRPTIATDPCDRGFMRGRWHQLRPNLGVYRGLVANADGELVGHVRGIYGVRRNGEHVMFGKFINRDGGFIGVINGRWGGGEIHARWLARTGEHGFIHGMYREGDRHDRLGGGFVARWAETRCAADLPR